MKNITLKVTGMMCNGCENRVINGLKTIEGIKEVKASHEKGIVEVESEDNITEDMIIEKIEDIGYEVEK